MSHPTPDHPSTRTAQSGKRSYLYLPNHVIFLLHVLCSANPRRFPGRHISISIPHTLCGSFRLKLGQENPTRSSSIALTYSTNAPPKSWLFLLGICACPQSLQSRFNNIPQTVGLPAFTPTPHPISLEVHCQAPTSCIVRTH